MKYIIAIIFAISITSCGEDFLETVPLGQETDANFPKTAEDAVAATYGAYNSLRLWRLHAGGFPLFDIMSDDAAKGSNPGDGLSTVGTFNDFTFDETSELIRNYYVDLYRAVRRTHLVLDNIEGIEMNADLKTRLTAECRFLRGFLYFYLTRAYGAVPVVLNGSPDSDILRTPRETIYQNIIIPDLTFAIENLEERSAYPESQLGRATRGAAKAMLARAYLFIGNFNEVERLTLEVINSGEYTLDPDFTSVFSVDGEHGSGSIFEIGAIPENFDAGGNQYANTWGIRGSSPNLGWGFGRPTIDLIEFFGDDDPRMDASVVFLGETIEGITIGGDGNTPDSTINEFGELEIETYNQKVFVPGTQARESFGHNRRMIRYADVLLMAAEALNENGNSAQALVYLNQVRERARGGDDGILPDITTTNQNQLRDIIIDERRRELCLEGLRYWDLVRTNKASEVLGQYGYETNKHELWPFPQAEIDISGGKLTQNVGY